MLENYRENENKKISNEEIDILDNSIESIFIFCLTWSFGCTGDYPSRLKFDKKLRSVNQKFPQEGLIYDYQFDITTQAFIPWSNLFADFEIEMSAQYHDIMIPTSDSTRNTFLTQTLLKMTYHVMCPGPTGTGKSMNIYALLNKMGDKFQYNSLTFSAQTSANQT